MPYLVSVVVPTKNRYQYLKHLISLVDSFKLNELELVIQDNSDNNNEIVTFLKKIQNGNIKYYYDSDKLSMSENADKAILNSTGEYVCFIGDDDGICRNIVACAKWMMKNDVEAIRSDNAYFRWNKGVILTKTKKVITHLSVKKELNNLIKNGMVLGNVKTPILYHGMVRRDIINQIFNKGKTFFPGSPPDISSSVCLCFIVTKYCSINIPVIINGSSTMTGGGVQKMGGVIDLNDVPFITQDDINNWEKSIPPIWSGIYAWANSGIKSLKYMMKHELIPKINYDYFFAYAVLRPKTFQYSLNFAHNKVVFYYYIFKVYFSTYSTRIYRKINSKKFKRVGNINTIAEAEAYFSLKSEGKDFFSS